ncbi:MAG: PhoX family phosphatase [Betaproteobacteria bacterium]|nr:PhoX family phosphatase [Betaproteobacteria bacterium]
MKNTLDSRRRVLKAGLASMVSTLPAWSALGGCAAGGASAPPMLGFTAVPVSKEDKVIVPPGYRADVLYRWGDAVGMAAGMPAFREDGGNSAEEQALQAGMHHDAIELFPLSESRALLAVNHEYTDDGLLHSDGMRSWSAEKVRKSQAAHGVAIVEIAFDGSRWSLVRPSRYARRITASTPIAFSGPAAGHALLRTAFDPSGREALGTMSNCAGGHTPWGTYLTCEENFNMYFSNAGAVPVDQKRYGISAAGGGYRWHEHDARFDAAANPNEPNRFGWVVEIDPLDPQAKPVKRTALGRIKHESATVTLAKDGRVVVYMGDDERYEYIYKFVSRGKFNPSDRAANKDLLDEGTLYVALFAKGGNGVWLELPGTPESLVRARQAADAVGATKMDRPEWIAVHPGNGDVYVSLTNNDRRTEAEAEGVNPRAKNVYGHIARWSERDGDAAATTFRWDIFALAGEDKGFANPDGLWFDRRGVLWIETDISTSAINRGPFEKLGNNQMLAADVRTGEIRRFLTGPAGCEITGVTMAPDGRTMFINIQHPGETASERSNPDEPRAVSNWPDFRPSGRPRSATIAIRREDGGVIGT